ncbi:MULTISPECIES: cidABC operon transcriptional activator CidR [Staphylococcus]|uniref:cidABC operon transcriptional activator CidR n=1 Tax=Staphylococcus TaxID=1279 RepID=UPI0001EF4E10|nr:MULTISPECIES: LysR family transcriptional regulator [Staphylococcus]EFS16284.1 transcriptional regulator, LysR family [Staphylococcus capitis C87]MBC3049294.1 LysR family transcriptional regulator [Staphylococcus capitis]MBC3069274.1 LysR family transcriptional regulator [Staphylococcus capitis]MBC3071541.1 LysR family transcriptional regulator [Staphylococcus capitis]MBC3082470.1 LysR family transcriptional regulator [Staphylococcus capitis]
MDIKHMKYFVEVVKQGGMTKASKSLYIAQPTISKAIKDIEAEMAVPLFDRSKRNLVLTDAGKIFFNKCKEIISLYDNLPTEINSLYGLETGHINISMSAVMSMRKFIGVLGDFHQLYPNITYNLIESGGKTTENLILNDEVDIGVTTLPVDHHLFESISLNKEDLRVVLYREHPLAYKTKIKMEELAEENFILFNEDFYLNDKIIENAKNAGFVPNMASQISQWNVIENLIINKLGITILPATISELLNDDVKMIQLENANTEWELGVVWKKDKRLSHATNKWIEFLKEKLTEQK